MKRLWLPFLLLGLMAVSVPVVADHVPTEATVPETIPHPRIVEGNGFDIFIKKATPTGSQTYWTAPYLFATPYTQNTGWIPGDRVAYDCAYAFLQQNGVIVGRVTFLRLGSANSYASVIDKWMNESQRFYDGTKNPDPSINYWNCPAASQAYEPTNVPDERPKVVYWTGDTALEIRDYTNTTTGVAGTTFDLVEVIHEPFQTITPVTGTPQTVNSRVTVLAREAGVPFAVVYYDGLGSGQVSEELLSEEGEC